MIRFCSAIGMVLLAVAGCAAPSSTTAPPGGAPVAFQEALFTLSEDAAGPITPGMAYSQSSFKSAFPGLTFQTVRTMTEGDVKWFLAGFDDGFQVFQVEPDSGKRKVSKVHVVGPRAAGPNGERIGMTYAETNGRSMKCRPGKDEWTGMAMCSPSRSRITYIYSPELYTGASGRLPPASELREARIVRIVWDGRS